MLFEETEEGRDECVCVAVCCSHTLQCVAVICCSRKRKRVVLNVCVLQCVAVICAAVCVAACCSHMLVAETEEGCDQYVCVAACCTHMLQRVAAICYSW